MTDAMTWQKEAFSVAYIAAWAARVGAKVLTSTLCHVDDEAVDLTLARRGIKFDVQMKCTHNPRLSSDGVHQSYSLDNRAYDILRQPERTCIAYLALVTVPADVEQWMDASDSEIILRGSGTYLCLEGLSEPTGQDKTVVKIPVKQRIDVESLDEMFERCKQRILHGVQGVGP